MQLKWQIAFFLQNYKGGHLGFKWVAKVIRLTKYHGWICCPLKPWKSGIPCHFYFLGSQYTRFGGICKLGKIPNYANCMHC